MLRPLLLFVFARQLERGLVGLLLPFPT